MDLFTFPYVASVLRYMPNTGDLVWKFNSNKSNLWNSKYAGVLAGSIFTSQHGMQYRRLKHNGVPYLNHRVIWFMITGIVPDFIDHKDRDGLNNRFLNLREATQSQNRANSGCPIRGIELYPNGKWRAKICVKKKQIHLGMFKTEAEAFGAYVEAHRRIFGEFTIYEGR